MRTTRLTTASGFTSKGSRLTHAELDATLIELIKGQFNVQTGTTYTLVASDAYKTITLDNAASITVTVPPESSVAFDVGVWIDLVQLGAGVVTASGAGPPTINGVATTRLPYQRIRLFKYLVDTWLAVPFGSFLINAADLTGTLAEFNAALQSDSFAALGTSQEFTKTQNFNATSLTSSSNSIAWDAESNQVFKHTATENTTLANPTNLKDGATYIFIFTQHASLAKTLAFGSAFKWPGGTAPTVSTGASAVDVMTFISDGTNMYGVSSLDFS